MVARVLFAAVMLCALGQRQGGARRHQVPAPAAICAATSTGVPAAATSPSVAAR